jgi:hypothetical protein
MCNKSLELAMFLYKIFLLILLSIFFISCGGGGGGNAANDPSPTSVTISGNVVDNYIVNATVCIDSNKNNRCDAGEPTTTSGTKGSYSFTNDSISSTDIVIAYGGEDHITGEPFNYFVKNVVSNKDSSNKVILSSINTLIVDYMSVANANLSDSQNAVVNFISGGSASIETSNAITDVIANKTTQSDEFEKSLKLFQMVAKINDVNNSTESAKSFNLLAQYIKNNNTKQDDDNISITNNTVKVLSSSDYIPVMLEKNVWNYYTDMTPENKYKLDVYDPNGRTLTYSILDGKDKDDFNISSNENGTIAFFTLPVYTNPTDSDFDGEYKIDVNVSNGTTSLIKEITINVLKYNKSVKAVVSSSIFEIEDDATVGSVLGSINITNNGSLDSEIIKYELNPSDANFDVNKTNGNIYVKDRTSFPDPSTGNIIERNISIRAKNSAGWSDASISTIKIYNVGELNSTATIQSETFETIFENNSSTQAVGTVTIAVDGGNSVDDYNITSDSSGYFSINSSGVITVANSFDFESQNEYLITVSAHNANGWGSGSTITIKIKDVNEAPSMSPAVETQTVSFGESIERTYTLNDGDSGTGVTQTVSISVSSNNSNVGVSKSRATGVDGDELVITLTGDSVGQSTITVVLDDNNGTLNGGIETKTYEFNTTVRSNGHKLYQVQKDSNYTNNSIVFDSITYDWNSTARWYETGTTILMPVEILKSAQSAYLAGNFNEVAEGHYYVNKAEYLWDSHKSQTHTSTTKYRNASGLDNNLTARNNNFQHDAYHTFL